MALRLTLRMTVVEQLSYRDQDSSGRSPTDFKNTNKIPMGATYRTSTRQSLKAVPA